VLDALYASGKKFSLSLFNFVWAAFFESAACWPVSASSIPLTGTLIFLFLGVLLGHMPAASLLLYEYIPLLVCILLSRRPERPTE
jgi:hypothetical protein